MFELWLGRFVRSRGFYWRVKSCGKLPGTGRTGVSQPAELKPLSREGSAGERTLGAKEPRDGRLARVPQNSCQ